MIAHFPSSLSLRLVFIIAALLIATALPAGASTGVIDPDGDKHEQEIERLLRRSESEFWSLKRRIERDRSDRQRRLERARADYEESQRMVESARAADKRDQASYRADRALEKYHTELERAISAVDSARVELDRIEQSVNRYRATLEAMRLRGRGTPQIQENEPATRDSSAVREPVTGNLPADRTSRS